MKAHEETWRVPDTEPRVVASVGPDDMHDYVLYADADTADAEPAAVARAKLAAQAPTMARLLLELQHVDTSDGEYVERCPCCLNKTYGHVEPGMFGIPVEFHPGKHADNCRLVAVLRAAGVVE